MVRSTDNGETWSDPFSLPDATRVLEVKVDPISRNRDVVLAGTDAGLFRSVDAERVLFPLMHCSGNGFGVSLDECGLARSAQEFPQLDSSAQASDLAACTYRVIVVRHGRRLQHWKRVRECRSYNFSRRQVGRLYGLCFRSDCRRHHYREN